LTTPKSMDAKSSWLKIGQRDAAAVARDPAVGAESPGREAVPADPAAVPADPGPAVTRAAGLAASPGLGPSLAARSANPSLKTRTRTMQRKPPSLVHDPGLVHAPSPNLAQDHPMTVKTTRLKPTEIPKRKRMMKIDWIENVECCVCVRE